MYKKRKRTIFLTTMAFKIKVQHVFMTNLQANECEIMNPKHA